MFYKDFITGQYQLDTLAVPRIATRWETRDYVGTLKVRWSIGRMKYRVEPGIYAVGNPDRNSNVFVSANYKLSFDHLRRALDGLNAWILVIDTKGINVWCAAGKKNFSTKEVVKRIRHHHLDQIVDHHRIILPQLSATGVAAHEVKALTGFNVTFGPVLASDIKTFLMAGMRATEEMRTVNFPFWERLKLIPVDMFYGKYWMILVPALFFILSGLFAWGYSIDKAVNDGWKAVVALYAGYLSGCAITPALLPWIPFRRFSLKGMFTGFIVSVILMFIGILTTSSKLQTINSIEIASWFLMISGLSAFMAMNFTGSSTYTSLSGVQKEMKVMLPVEIGLVALGLIGWIIAKFI